MSFIIPFLRDYNLEIPVFQHPNVSQNICELKSCTGEYTNFGSQIIPFYICLMAFYSPFSVWISDFFLFPS